MHEAILSSNVFPESKISLTLSITGNTLVLFTNVGKLFANQVFFQSYPTILKKVRDLCCKN